MCLHNEPSKQIEEGYCGDYIVNRMDGEECDCGAVDTCDDRCCHPNNCTLVTGGWLVYYPSNKKSPSSLLIEIQVPKKYSWNNQFWLNEKLD